ncbi:MAG: hypothetical protein KIT72_06940 [Polyangiaceae bacterium]|nr:hypothetical protein [Polyangiaceae bacterium]
MSRLERAFAGHIGAAVMATDASVLGALRAPDDSAKSRQHEVMLHLAAEQTQAARG